MTFLIKVAINAVALWVAEWLLSGITISGDTTGERVLTLLIVALIFGVINTFVGPVIKILALPFIVVTLGLMLFVINALLLWFTSWLAGVFNLGFHVDGFWSAFWGGLIISAVSWVIATILPDSVA